VDVRVDHGRLTTGRIARGKERFQRKRDYDYDQEEEGRRGAA
jgi:hypothetical protein